MVEEEKVGGALKTLSRRHAISILDYIAEKKVVSSSEVVIGTGTQPAQAYRALNELERGGFIKREMKKANITKPHVFWEATKRGKYAIACIDDFQQNVL